MKETIKLADVTKEKKLFLHIGLPKTGTSYLQTIFNFDRDNGSMIFHYPKDKYKKKSYVPTAGNAADLCIAIKNNNYDEAKKLFLSNVKDHNNILLSSEIFSTFTDDEILFLKDLARKFKVKLTIICFVRDLYDFYWSAYSQTIKRGGEHRRFIENAKERPVCIDRVFKYSEIGDLKIFHYDDLSDLLKPFVDLGVIKLKPNKNLKINVSLTLKQMTFIKVLNKFLPKRVVAVISDMLARRNKPIPPPYDAEVEEFITKNYADLIEKINTIYEMDVKLGYKYK